MSELASQGAQSVMVFGKTATPTTLNWPVEFISESLTKQGKVLDTNGIRGTRSHSYERLRDGTYTVSGNISINPSPADMTELNKWILGSTGQLTEGLLPISILIRRGPTVAGLTNCYTYAGCYVNTATFKAQAGGLVTLDLNIIGTTQTVADSSSLGTPLGLVPGYGVTDIPMCMSDATLTLGGVPHDMMDFELTIDNKLDARFTNSLTATSITPQDREIRLKLTTPHTVTEDSLYDLGATGITGASSIALSNGTYGMTWSMVHLAGDSVSPTVGGKTEVPLVLDLIARKSGAIGAPLELVAAIDVAA